MLASNNALKSQTFTTFKNFRKTSKSFLSSAYLHYLFAVYSVTKHCSHTWASTQLCGVGEILKISKGGRIFWKNFWRGIDFMASKGGISLTTLHQNSRIFLKFSKNIFSRGGYLQIIGSKIFSRGGIFCSRQSLLKGGSRNQKKFCRLAHV